MPNEANVRAAAIRDEVAREVRERKEGGEEEMKEERRVRDGGKRKRVIGEIVESKERSGCVVARVTGQPKARVV